MPLVQCGGKVLLKLGRAGVASCPRRVRQVWLPHGERVGSRALSQDRPVGRRMSCDSA